MADPTNDETPRKRKPCNTVIDRLARPNKRLVLALWDNYAHNFAPEKKEAIRLLLQELYAMTPEETQKYFDQIDKIMKKMAARARLKKKQLRRYKARKRRIARKRAFNKFKKILVRGMIYASKHPIPPLVSPRLRTMADVILEQICDIRGIEPPKNRFNTDKQAQFLLNLADWAAIAIEHVYYEIQVHKNQQLDLIEEQIRAEEAAKASAARKARSKSSKASRVSSRDGDISTPDP